MLNHSCTGLTGVRSPAFAPSVALLVASFKKIWFFSNSLFQSLIPETLASDVFVCSYSLQTLTFFVRYSVFKVRIAENASAFSAPGGTGAEKITNFDFFRVPALPFGALPSGKWA